MEPFNVKDKLNICITDIQEKIFRNKKIISNFSYMSAYQVFNMLIAFATYPFLIRVVGKDTYGLVVFVQSVISYLVIIVNFGFNVSATKDVSVNRNDKSKLSIIVSSVLILKCFLFLFTIIILCFTIFFVPHGKENRVLYILSMYTCFYEFIFPIWYFQGMEKMENVTFLNIISRSVFFVLIFVLIKSPQDYLLIPIINGTGCIIAGGLAIYIVFWRDKLKFVLIPFDCLVKLFKESFPYFLSSASVLAYASANKVFVGIFLGMKEVAYYDLAEKILQAVKIPQWIAGLAIFPKIAYTKSISYINKVMWHIFKASCILFILAVFSSKFIVKILGGPDMMSALPVTRIMLVSILFIAINNYLGTYRLVPFNYSKEYAKMITSTAFFYFIAIGILYLLNIVSLYSLGSVIVLVEVWATIVGYFYCNRFNLIKEQ